MVDSSLHQSTSQTSEEPLRMPRILVVDDTPANLLAMEAELATLGAAVDRASSGEAALRLLLDGDFALILLDVNMPGMDGFEVARVIRSRKRSEPTPIVFVTAYDRDDRDVRAAYELGAVDFLFRPIVPEVLRAKARVFIELSKQAELIRRHERREHARALEMARRAWQEEALRERMEQLADLDRRKDQFLAVLGHELRNPLAPLLTGLELLKHKLGRDPRGDLEMSRTWEAMHRQVEHLVRLVDDLLDVSRINSDKLELQRSCVPIQDIVAQAVAMSRPWFDQRAHQLTIAVPEEPVFVDADRVRLVQVVANLLNNAARYTPPEGTVSVACRIVDGEVEVRVSDNGHGIPTDMLSRVFEPFVQDGRHRSSGLGLGLAIVHRLVLLHGGSVFAESAGPGQGSEFVVRVPLANAPSETDAEQSARSGDRPVFTEGMSVVVVDDNADIRHTLQALLTAWGHTVEVADDGLVGMELILKVRPDVAFVDIQLPGSEGYDVAARVKRDAGANAPRLVAITGFGQEGDRQRAMGAGFDGYLVKPVEASALRAALARRAG